MSFILSLIAGSTTHTIEEAAVDSLLRQINVSHSGIDWLDPGTACDVHLPKEIALTVSNLLESVRETLAGAPIDVNVIPAADRRKRLLIADMDSTMIGQECIDELGDVAGVGDQIRDVTRRAMRGDIEFEAALRDRVSKLAGLPARAIETVIQDRITFTPGGRTLVQTMKASGAYCALVSGGFTQFTGYVAAECGFDMHQANQLKVRDGELTGEIIEPALGRNAKVETLYKLISSHGIYLTDVIAVGDGANDIGMLQEAGMGVALHAKPIVKAAADMRIDHGDLTALLYLQGYRRSQFVLG